MIVKYGLGYELFGFGPAGFLAFAPVVQGPEGGLVSTGAGVNLSTGILIAHGWFYVLYLFSCFRLWSLMRWRGIRLLVLAAGGVVPFLSFFLEARIGREVRAYLAKREADASAAPSGEAGIPPDQTTPPDQPSVEAAQ